jgi:cell division protease FtsH
VGILPFVPLAGVLPTDERAALRQSHKTILIWLILIVVFVSIYSLFTDSSSKDEPKKMTDLRAELLEDKAREKNTKLIEHIRIEPGARQEARYVIKYRDNKRAIAHGPYMDSMVALLDDSGVDYDVRPRGESSIWPQLLLSWLPMIFLFAIFFFFMRQLQAGGGKAMSFGESKAKLLTDSQNRITFKDVAGVEEAKDEVEEIIAFLKDPKKFTKLGGRIPKGVLMMGPPGTGKTLLARAIAGEAGVPFFSISGSDFVEMFVGVGASRVRDLFEQGKKNAPCIIFIDEIDAVGRHRGAGLGGGHDEREQTLNQLLVEMDGFESNDGVIIIAATNRPDVLDPALLRPGRFDRRIVVPRPDLRGRIGILNVHVRRVPLSAAVDLDVIARGTPGFSGADLESLVNEAALIAARRDKDKVDMEDFEEAKDKVLMGAERRSMIISEKEKRTTAVHEAGHALAARFVAGPEGEEADPVHKVTIIPRGRALGLTQQLPTEDRLNMTREFALNQIAILLGGRVAEEIIFHKKTTGAGNDIERATELARAMVTEWGMSDEFGPLNFAGSKQEVFLGRDFTSSDRHSEDTSRRIDAEIRRIVLEQYERVTEILKAHRGDLERVTEALLDYETIDGEDIDVLLRGDKITRPLPAARRKTENEAKDEKKRPSLIPPIKSGDPEPEPA